jgi:CheY-like chemotaxis protein
VPQATIATLLVEDSRAFAEVFQEAVLADGPFAVTHVESLAAATAAVATGAYDVILLDLSLPDSAGPETVARMHAAAPAVPIVVITCEDDDQLGVALLQAGADDYLTKDRIAGWLLERAVRHAIERKRLHREREEVIARLDQALADVKQLSGMLPICAHCKKVRDDAGYWKQIERYVQERSEAEFSHGICPQCLQEEYAEYLDDVPDGALEPGSSAGAGPGAGAGSGERAGGEGAGGGASAGEPSAGERSARDASAGEASAGEPPRGI